MRLPISAALACFIILGGTPAASQTAQRHYGDPPTSLALPSVWSAETATQAKGNLARWEYAHQNDGAWEPVGGYFMVVDGQTDPFFPAGSIFSGEMQEQSRHAGSLTPVAGPGLCGVPESYAEWSDVVYLGPNFDPAWNALSAQIRVGAGPALRGAPELAFGRLTIAETNQQNMQYWLDRWLTDGGAGTGRVRCIVGADGWLSCYVEARAPYQQSDGHNGELDQTAASIVSNLRIAPQSKDGVATAGACVNVAYSLNEHGAFSWSEPGH